MIQDPQNNDIRTINHQTPLQDKTVLEIGCGSGRITRDIAIYADKVVATEVDQALLEKAAANLENANVELLLTPDGKPDLPAASFDLVIYSLSLHHILTNKMKANLLHSGSLLKKNGKIVVIEPGEKGSFLEIKKRFGASSGDESKEKAAAV